MCVLVCALCVDGPVCMQQEEAGEGAVELLVYGCWKSPSFLLLGSQVRNPSLGLGWLVPKDLGRDRGICTRVAVIRNQLGRGSWKRHEESRLASQAISMPPLNPGAASSYPGWGDSWLSFDPPRPSPGGNRMAASQRPGLSGYRRQREMVTMASVFGLGFSLKELP